MKITIRRRLIGAFAVVMACLVVVSVVSYWSATKLDETSKWKLHSRQVLLGLERIIIRLLDAEAGQRGYIITGEEEYLKPYDLALGKLGERTAELRQLTQDNPAQQARMDKLDSMLTEKIKALSEMVYLMKDKGFDAAKEKFTTETDEKIMDNIRKLIAEMNDEELKILKTRELVADQAKKAMDMTCLFGTIIALVFSALVVFVINRSITKPIEKLTEAANAISKGDTTIEELKVASDDEIGKLTESFNRMSASIKLLLREAGQK